MDGPWVIDPTKMAKLDGLSPEQQKVLSLVLDARKTYDEAAQILGVSASVVRERAHDAIDTLANNPARVPPPAPSPQDPTQAESNPSLKGGLLVGLVLGAIAAAVILISSGGGKSSTTGRTLSSPAARFTATTRFAPAPRKYVPPTTKSISPATSRPIKPAKVKSISHIATRATATTAPKKPALGSKPALTKPAVPATSLLSLAANPRGQLKYDTKSLTANTGKVSIDFTNSSAIIHNLTVASLTGSVIGHTPTFKGASRTLELILKPGTYKFYCSVPGHRMAGMEGTLTVR